MTEVEVSDCLLDIEVLSGRLKAVLSVLSNDLSQETVENAVRDFRCRTEVFCSLIDIANIMSFDVVTALAKLNDDLNKKAPAPTKVTGESKTQLKNNTDKCKSQMEVSDENR